MIMNRFCGWACAAILAASVGCEESSQVDTHAVMGTVTLNGNPVEGAMVTFAPAGGGPTAVGTTDSTGAYQLTTYQRDDGAVVGSHAVTISKFDGPPPETGGAPATPPASEAVEDITNEYPADYDPNRAAEPPPSQNLLPAQYADPSTSGLKAEVKEGENTFNFDLKG